MYIESTTIICVNFVSLTRWFSNMTSKASLLNAIQLNPSVFQDYIRLKTTSHGHSGGEPVIWCNSWCHRKFSLTSCKAVRPKLLIFWTCQVNNTSPPANLSEKPSDKPGVLRRASHQTRCKPKQRQRQQRKSIVLFIRQFGWDPEYIHWNRMVRRTNHLGINPTSTGIHWYTWTSLSAFQHLY